MTVAIACVLVAAVMPYLFVALTGMPATGQRARWGTGYDNREPREYLAGLDGWRRRARAGEANAHEAFAPFAVAVILAQSAHAAQSWVDALAVTFVCARAAHGAFYVGDKPTLRSVSWFAGAACVLGLFVLAMWR